MTRKSNWLYIDEPPTAPLGCIYLVLECCNLCLAGFDTVGTITGMTSGTVANIVLRCAIARAIVQVVSGPGFIPGGCGVGEQVIISPAVAWTGWVIFTATPIDCAASCPP